MFLCWRFSKAYVKNDDNHNIPYTESNIQALEIQNTDRKSPTLSSKLRNVIENEFTKLSNNTENLQNQINKLNETNYVLQKENKVLKEQYSRISFEYMMLVTGSGSNSTSNNKNSKNNSKNAYNIDLSNIYDSDLYRSEITDTK